MGPTLAPLRKCSQVQHRLPNSACAHSRDPLMRRCSVKFVDGATRNAEQIELFYNARQSDQSEDGNVFVCSDYLRQVTYSLSTTMGVARQEVGEYQHFWMFRRQASGSVRAHDLICLSLVRLSILLILTTHVWGLATGTAATFTQVLFPETCSLPPISRSCVFALAYMARVIVTRLALLPAQLASCVTCNSLSARSSLLCVLPPQDCLSRVSHVSRVTAPRLALLRRASFCCCYLLE